MKKALLLALLLPTAALSQPEVWTDGARTTLNEALDTTETGIDILDGSAFPTTPGAAGYFRVTVRRASDLTVFEILQCTARSTNTLTCARDCVSGTCDGTGTTFSVGDLVYHSITATALARFELAVQPTRSLTAGTGLTGGGDLSADRTFNVVANADGSIVANANDIQVGVLASDAQHGVRGGGTQHANAVASGAAGFMTGTDKAKLDGIASGADDVGGSAREVQYNNGSSALAGATGAIVDRNNLVLRQQTTTPTVAAAGLTILYGSGLDSCPNMPPRFMTLGIGTSATTPSAYLRTPLFDKRWGMWASSALLNSGILSPAAANGCTVSAAAPADTSDYTRRPRYQCQTAATSGTTGRINPGANELFRSNVSGRGGFFVAHLALGWSSIATGRGFYGVGITVSSGAQSACTNCAGFAHELSQTNLHWYVNDASGTATDTDLGANFPVDATAAYYDMYVYSAANGSTIEYCLVRKDASFVAYGSSSSNLPVNTTGIRPLLSVDTGSTNTAAGWQSTATYYEIGL